MVDPGRTSFVLVQPRFPSLLPGFERFAGHARSQDGVPMDEEWL